MLDADCENQGGFSLLCSFGGGGEDAIERLVRGDRWVVENRNSFL